MNRVKFVVRQGIKILTRSLILPFFYRLACLRHPEPEERLVVFADAHHDGVFPESMDAVREAVLARGYRVETYIRDYQRSSFLSVTRSMIAFMDAYARARAVFLCDYFLPATACRKRPGTKVVQLWHACGALKRFGYDADDDIPSYYSRNMFQNYDIITVSGKKCVPYYAEAFHLPEKRVAATGVSRTDRFFDPEYGASCRREFVREYPEAAGKKIVLWAPTFRGNAAMPVLLGEREIRLLRERIREDWFLVVKLHPHMKEYAHISHTALATEKLLPVADVLISDFSSVMFEYSLFDRPILRFAPDGEAYLAERGIYPEGLPAAASDWEELWQAWQQMTEGKYDTQWQSFCRTQMSSCDGHATERILAAAGL